MLAVTAVAIVILPALELDDLDLFVFGLVQHRGLDPGAGNQRITDLDAGTIADQQYLGKFDFVTRGGVELLHFERIAFAGAVLLTACSEYGVHQGLRRGPGLA